MATRGRHRGGDGAGSCVSVQAEMGFLNGQYLARYRAHKCGKALHSTGIRIRSFT